MEWPIVSDQFLEVPSPKHEWSLITKLFGHWFGKQCFKLFDSEWDTFVEHIDAILQIKFLKFWRQPSSMPDWSNLEVGA